MPFVDTAWSHRPATDVHKYSLWKQLRNPLSQALPFTGVSSAEAFALEKENGPKFSALHVFWIRLSDFMDIVPRHPHLSGIRFATRDFVLLQQQMSGSSIVAADAPNGGTLDLRGGRSNGGVDGGSIKEEGSGSASGSPPTMVNGNGAGVSNGVPSPLVNGHR